MTLAFVYYRYRGLSMVQGVLAALRPAVVAMIASACLSLMVLSFYGTREIPADMSHIQVIPVIIFIIAVYILRKWKIDPIIVMIGAGVAGILLLLLFYIKKFKMKI